MKKEAKRLPSGLEVNIITRDDGTALVETKDREGRLVELREFSTLEEADRHVAELVRGDLGEDPTLEKREKRFQKMGLTEAEAVVAARGQA